jgi:3-methylcrotonyl-CoA carboxylase alpha subunit
MRSEWKDGDRLRTVEWTARGSGRYRVSVDGVELDVAVEPLADGRLRLTTTEGSSLAEVTAVGAKRFVRLGRLDWVLERETQGRRRGGRQAGGGLEAPMPGVVTRVMVAAGDAVRKGQPLLAIEAMKMEHLIRSPRDGKVTRVAARTGELVNGGVPLVELEEPA